MGDIQPFQVTQEHIELTEAQRLEVKNRLFGLRKQYVKEVWHSGAEASVRDLEEEIGRLEHTLAHARVIY
jgi:hypothetical protein